VQRAQGSTTKSQLRHNNGADEQIFGCYVNGRRARVIGGTTPPARHAQPSGYSRISEEASALPAARGAEQQGGISDIYVGARCVCHGRVRQSRCAGEGVVYNLESDSTFHVTKAVAEYYLLHRNLRLAFNNFRPKKSVEHLVAEIKPATLKALIERKLEMDK
jgi:hypothetical protein